MTSPPPSSQPSLHRRAQLVRANGDLDHILVDPSPPEELSWQGIDYELDAIRSGDGFAVYREVPPCAPTTSSSSTTSTAGPSA